MPYVDLNSIHNPSSGTAAPATWGDGVRDDFEAGFGSTWVHARVYNNANISITNATNTALTFNSERVDVGGCHSTVSNTGRLTVPTGWGGWYQIGGTVDFASNATGFRAVWIQLNGTTRLDQVVANAVNGNAHTMSIFTEYQLAAADYVELFVFQSSGGALNVTASGNYSPEFHFSWRGV